MLPLGQKIAFFIFALLAVAAGAHSWRRLLRRIARGQKDTDLRFNRPLRRLSYSILTTITQRRTFRKRPVVSFFHSLIFYGFAFYLLVNLVDGSEGYIPFTIQSTYLSGAIYNLLADVFSALTLVGVIALIVRRFALPNRRDFAFNQRTMLHPAFRHSAVRVDSLIVSTFILVHVGCRALGAGAALARTGPDKFQPFATLISLAFDPQKAHVWREVSYWGALGSVLLFLAYFPSSKHIHLIFAPIKYAVARSDGSGVLPTIALDADADEPRLGASRLEDLSWPRLLDAYACIQCNRCQDVCPATATGKALSPSAFEINKRLELNELTRNVPSFESGAPSPKPLLSFALSVDAVWGCTTCGACMEVCPVQDEPMLDIIDIRRRQVMMEGEFPAQLRSAFRGMERSQNPWGINREQRMVWAEGLHVQTIEENPHAEVLFWVGCAASYDPQSQSTARAFVRLLNHAGVDFAVLGKKECCTGDMARRAGNEYLYRQLADQNISTLSGIEPKLIVATCPHCMNTVGNEYAQLGGSYKVMHHSEYLDSLVSEGKLQIVAGDIRVAFHDPCYLGRHNGVYDAPRNLLHVLSSAVVELDRNRENSFCCGAGGAQFWKEEEAGEQRISENRYAEAESKLGYSEESVLAVGCPFCKSMLQSAGAKGSSQVAVKDVAELLLERVETASQSESLPPVDIVIDSEASASGHSSIPAEESLDTVEAQLKEAPAKADSSPQVTVQSNEMPAAENHPPPRPGERKKWTPRTARLPISEAEALPATGSAAEVNPDDGEQILQQAMPEMDEEAKSPSPRKTWQPKRPSKQD